MLTYPFIFFYKVNVSSSKSFNHAATETHAGRIDWLRKKYIPKLAERLGVEAITPDSVLWELDGLRLIDGMKFPTRGNATDKAAFVFEYLAQQDPTPSSRYLNTILDWTVGTRRHPVFWNEAGFEAHKTRSATQAKRYAQVVAAGGNATYWPPSHWYSLRHMLVELEKAKHHHATGAQIVLDVGMYTSARHLHATIEARVRQAVAVDMAKAEATAQKYWYVAREEVMTRGAIFVGGDNPRHNFAVSQHGWTLLHIKRKSAAVNLGQDSDWCTGDPNKKDFYTTYNDGLLWLLDTRTGERFQMHFGQAQFQDTKSHEVGLVNLLGRYPGLLGAVENFAHKHLDAGAHSDAKHIQFLSSISFAGAVPHWRNRFTPLIPPRLANESKRDSWETVIRILGAAAGSEEWQASIDKFDIARISTRISRSENGIYMPVFMAQCRTVPHWRRGVDDKDVSYVLDVARDAQTILGVLTVAKDDKMWSKTVTENHMHRAAKVILASKEGKGMVHLLELADERPEWRTLLPDFFIPNVLTAMTDKLDNQGLEKIFLLAKKHPVWQARVDAWRQIGQLRRRLGELKARI